MYGAPIGPASLALRGERILALFDLRSDLLLVDSQAFGLLEGRDRLRVLPALHLDLSATKPDLGFLGIDLLDTIEHRVGPDQIPLVHQIGGEPEHRPRVVRSQLRSEEHTSEL